MYESPITIYNHPVTTHDEIKKIVQKFEDEQCEAITATIYTEYGIRVDKEELLKALKYDRDQYRKGYNDGYAKGLAAGTNQTASEVFDYVKQQFHDQLDEEIQKIGFNNFHGTSEEANDG